MDDLTNWQCSNCGAMNVDCEKETVFPMCEVCGESFEWLEICPTPRVPDAGDSVS